MVKQNATVRSSAHGAWRVRLLCSMNSSQLQRYPCLLIEQTSLEGPVSIDAGGRRENQPTRIKTLKLRGDKEIYATFEADQKRLWAMSEPRQLGDFFGQLYSVFMRFNLPLYPQLTVASPVPRFSIATPSDRSSPRRKQGSDKYRISIPDPRPFFLWFCLLISCSDHACK